MNARVSTGSPGNDVPPDLGSQFDGWWQDLPKPSMREVMTSLSRRRCPSAGSPGWLPDGWIEQDRFEEFYPQEDLYLVRTPNGWALVNHAADPHPATGLYDSAATLCGLYERYRDAVGDFTVREPVARWLGSALSSFYDPTIEDEAAARTIVGLGGTVGIEPRAATVVAT